VEENKQLAAQKHQQSTTLVVDETLERLQSEAVSALKNQLYFITQEKQTLEKLWRSSQATVVGLEHEIREYRTANKSKQEYIDTIKAQQLILQDLKRRINDQATSVESVRATKNKLEEQLQAVTSQLEDCKSSCLRSELCQN
jgi:chromosome segregation ATPase